jgi:hypothetical protein
MVSPMAFERAHTEGAVPPGIAKSAAVLDTVRARPGSAGTSVTGSVPADLDSACGHRRGLLAALSKTAGVPTNGAQINFCDTGHWASLGCFVASEILGNT